MSLGFERSGADKGRESSGNINSALHKALDYSTERLKIALEAHTVLSEETKKMVEESLSKITADAFMSDVLDHTLSDRYDGKTDEEKATHWLINSVADDVMPNFAQNAGRYADPKQANALLTFFRGLLHQQPM